MTTEASRRRILAVPETIGREKSLRRRRNCSDSSPASTLTVQPGDENRGGEPPPPPPLSPPLFAISLLLLSPRSLLFFLPRRIPLNLPFFPSSFFSPLRQKSEKLVFRVVSNLENSPFPLLSLPLLSRESFEKYLIRWSFIPRSTRRM